MESIPGWYPDPFVKDGIRYWDGRQWTSHRGVRKRPDHPPAPPHPTLPLWVGIGSVLAIVIPVVVVRVMVRVFARYDWPLLVYMILATVVGYLPTLLWWRYVSGRAGRGGMRATVGVFGRRLDLAFGPAAYIAAIMAAAVTLMLVRAMRIPYAGNLEGAGGGVPDRAYVISVVVSAVLAAPIVEEIAFRGLIMRSFLGVMRPWQAIALQGLIFGAVHIDPERGARNVGLALVLGGAGIAFGTTAYLTRRLAPSIAGHAIFNGIAMAVVLHNLDYF